MHPGNYRNELITYWILNPENINLQVGVLCR
jgi:hypothetical protein